MSVSIHFGSNGAWKHYSELPDDFHWKIVLATPIDSDPICPMVMLARRSNVSLSTELKWDVLNDEYAAMDVLCWWNGIAAPNLDLVGDLLGTGTHPNDKKWEYGLWVDLYATGKSMLAGEVNFTGVTTKKQAQKQAKNWVVQAESAAAADLALADLIKDGGLLPPDMAAKFAEKLIEATGPATGLPFSEIAEICQMINSKVEGYGPKTTALMWLGKKYKTKEILSDFAHLTKPLPTTTMTAEYTIDMSETPASDKQISEIAAEIDKHVLSVVGVTGLDAELAGPLAKDVPKGKPAVVYEAIKPFAQGMYEYKAGDKIYPGELAEHQLHELHGHGIVKPLDPPKFLKLGELPPDTQIKFLPESVPSTHWHKLSEKAVDNMKKAQETEQPVVTAKQGSFGKVGGPYGKLIHTKPENLHAAPSFGGLVVENYADAAPHLQKWPYTIKVPMTDTIAQALRSEKGWKVGTRVRNVYCQKEHGAGDLNLVRVTGQVYDEYTKSGETMKTWKAFDVLV